ncbi:unnamed protein product [Brugia pahangi]|uniref:m7GpppX diphosphatase n=1 Tax=Brugia pahangi TaxID=6280 RepID=A0A0N4T6B0_BRUPA|nr:unnamed protein product [Brugia pahangi]
MDIMAADEIKITDDTKICNDLKGFKFKEILGEDATRKITFVLLDVNNCNDQAVLIVEKTPFPMDEQDWNTIVSQCSLETLSMNDIYSNHILFPPEKFSGNNLYFFHIFYYLIIFFEII